MRVYKYTVQFLDCCGEINKMYFDTLESAKVQVCKCYHIDTVGAMDEWHYITDEDGDEYGYRIRYTLVDTDDIY